MKKIFALVLALVMAMSLATVAWGAPVTVADTAALQDALDNAESGTVIKLTSNVAYGTVYLRPTDSNVTSLTCYPEYCGYTTNSANDFRTHWDNNSMNSGHVPYYKAAIENVTIIGAEDATIAGVQAHSCHIDTNVPADAVLGNANTGGYYAALNISNLTFKDVAFTRQVNIESSLEDAVYDGVTFDSCTFTTGGTASGDGAAIRYYNESNNGNVKNITVNNCSFNTCYQGVYAQRVNGVTVTDCSFDTTGHNAISNLHSGAIKVEIIGNTFKNIGDRVIRFDEVGADSNITINNNIIMGYCGDSNGELIKANSVASTAVNLESNYWGVENISTAIVGFNAPTAVGITGGTWDFDVSPYIAIGMQMTNNGDGTYSVSTPAPTPTPSYPYYTPVVEDTTVDSAQTFDAGIALYVGVSVLGAVGTVALGKKRED